MSTLELKKELGDLLDDAQSVQSLDPLKRGALKDKLLSLPDKNMRQAVEQLRDEKVKMAKAASEITKMSVEARNEARALHSLALKEQRKGEALESEDESELILEGLKKEKGSSGKHVHRRRRFLIYIVLGVCVVLLLLKYFNYF
jgi:hypothetical protein